MSFCVVAFVMFLASADRFPPLTRPLGSSCFHQGITLVSLYLECMHDVLYHRKRVYNVRTERVHASLPLAALVPTHECFMCIIIDVANDCPGIIGRIR